MSDNILPDVDSKVTLILPDGTEQEATVISHPPSDDALIVSSIINGEAVSGIMAYHAEGGHPEGLTTWRL